MTTRAIFVGSFDPITYGHLDIINRSLCLFDQVIVGLGVNSSKKTFFSLEERVSLTEQVIREELPNLSDNVHVITYDGLTVTLAKQFGSCCLVRGVRTPSDYEYEYNIAIINSKIAPGLETILLMADPNKSAISSSAVKELARFNCDVSKFVPSAVTSAISKKLKG